VTLADLPATADVRVLNLAVEPSVRLRMREIGLRDGAVVRVWGTTAFGGRVVVLGGSRIALDAATARAVEVSLAV
jgi:ferrous iron transport protein A